MHQLKISQTLEHHADFAALLEQEALEMDGTTSSVEELRLRGAAERAALALVRDWGVAWRTTNSYVRNYAVWRHVVAITPYVSGATCLDVAAAITDALEHLGME